MLQLYPISRALNVVGAEAGERLNKGKHFDGVDLNVIGN